MDTTTVDTTPPSGATPSAVQAGLATAAAEPLGLEALSKSEIPGIPEIESLKAGRQLTSRLNPQQLAIAEQEAKLRAGAGVEEIANIGAAQEQGVQQAIKFTGKLVREDVRVCELGEVGELTTELRNHLKSLGVGDLKQRWWDDLISHIPVLSKYADRLNSFIARYEKITDRLEEIFRAMRTEGIELHELHAKASTVREVDKQRLQDITVAGAAVEILLKQKEKAFKEESEKMQGKQLDEEDLEEIRQMQLELGALDRRLVNLKVMRVELITSMRTMQDLMMIVSQTESMLQEQIEMQEAIWTNQINQAVIEYKARGAITLIKDARDFTKKLMETNQSNQQKTMAEAAKLAGEPGIDVETLKKYIAGQTKMHDELQQAQVTNRTKLRDAAKQMDEIDKQLAEKSSDLATLNQMLAATEGDEDLVLKQ